MAAKPVRMGSSPVSEAAANAAMATGGVIIDIMPKYRMNKCAAIGSTPTSTRAGATRVASIK